MLTDQRSVYTSNRLMDKYYTPLLKGRTPPPITTQSFVDNDVIIEKPKSKLKEKPKKAKKMKQRLISNTHQDIMKVEYDSGSIPTPNNIKERAFRYSFNKLGR